MKDSDVVDQIYPALVAVQSAIDTQPLSTYSALLEVIRKPFADNDLALVVDTADLSVGIVVATPTLIHKSGEWVAGESAGVRVQRWADVEEARDRAKLLAAAELLRIPVAVMHVGPAEEPSTEAPAGAEEEKPAPTFRSLLSDPTVTKLDAAGLKRKASAAQVAKIRTLRGELKVNDDYYHGWLVLHFGRAGYKEPPVKTEQLASKHATNVIDALQAENARRG